MAGTQGRTIRDGTSDMAYDLNIKHCWCSCHSLTSLHTACLMAEDWRYLTSTNKTIKVHSMHKLLAFANILWWWWWWRWWRLCWWRRRRSLRLPPSLLPSCVAVVYYKQPIFRWFSQSIYFVNLDYISSIALWVLFEQVHHIPRDCFAFLTGLFFKKGCIITETLVVYSVL